MTEEERKKEQDAWMKKLKITNICSIVAFVVGLYLNFGLSGGNFVGAALILFGLIVFIWTHNMIKDEKKDAAVKEMECTFSDGEFAVSKRGLGIRNYVLIKNDYNSVVKYEPLTLHVGSATVGGVTTGGAFTTGGKNYISGFKKSGKYKLVYDGHTIFKIKLTDEQYKTAVKSKISKYLNKSAKTIQVVDSGTLSESEMRTMFDSLKSTDYLSGGGEYVSKGMPSYEKCVEILDWLCGSDA